MHPIPYLDVGHSLNFVHMSLNLEVPIYDFQMHNTVIMYLRVRIEIKWKDQSLLGYDVQSMLLGLHTLPQAPCFGFLMHNMGMEYG